MIKISDLPSASALGGTELVPIVQSGTTRQTTAQAIANLASGVATQTHAATDKTTPVDADELPLADSAASYGLKKVTWANVKATLKTYFDTLYLATVTPGTAGNLLTSNGSAWVSTTPAAAATVETGAIFDYVGSTAPAGYVLLSGLTIGNGSSGGTARANADTAALFTLLWNSMSNTEAPVSTGRGASAAADFAANKTITLPDARGRVVAGKDNMGGSAASRLTSAGSSTDGATLGASGGAQNVTLTAAESGLPSHAHGFTFAGGGGTPTDTYLNSSFGTGTVATAGTASYTNAGPSNASSAHNNTQPTLVLNKIIKL